MLKIRRTLSRFSCGISPARHPSMLLERHSSSPSSVFTEDSTSEEAMSDCNCNHEAMRLRSKLQDSVKEIKSNEEVNKLCIECPQIDLYEEDLELYNLMVDFFNKRGHILKLFESMENSLEKAHNGECLIHQALQDFQEEKRLSGEDASFRKTLEDLKSFKECSEEDLFAPDFVEELRSCHEDMFTLYCRLMTMMNKIDEKLRRTQRQRKIIVGVAAGVVALLAVPAAITFGSNVFNGIGSVASEPWSWCNKQETIADLKRKRDAVKSMKTATRTEMTQTNNTMVLMKKLDDLYKSIRESAGMAVEKKSPVNVVMGTVEKLREPYESTEGELDRMRRGSISYVHLALTELRNTFKAYLSKGKHKMAKVIRVVV